MLKTISYDPTKKNHKDNKTTTKKKNLFLIILYCCFQETNTERYLRMLLLQQTIQHSGLRIEMAKMRRIMYILTNLITSIIQQTSFFFFKDSYRTINPNVFSFMCIINPGCSTDRPHLTNYSSSSFSSFSIL